MNTSICHDCKNFQYKTKDCIYKKECYNTSKYEVSKITRDMDFNELKVGDMVLFSTGAKTIARAKIVEIRDYTILELRTLSNRKSTVFAKYVLLDTTIKK